METIGVTKFRKNLSSCIKKVQQGQRIAVTYHGHRIAMLVPVEAEMEITQNALRKLRKTAYVGDVASPIDDQWKSME